MGKRQPSGETGSMTPGNKPTDEWLEDFTEEEIRLILVDLREEKAQEAMREGSR